MLRRLFWIIVGAVLALQADRWWRAKRSSFTPNAITGTILDKVNERLEAGNRRASEDAPRG